MSVKNFGSSSSNYAKNRAQMLKNDAILQKRKNEQKKSSSITKSSWTPLGTNNTKLNEKLFCERKDLICSWFDKWNDAQRREILHRILDKCSLSQKQFIDSIVHPEIPIHQTDFSRILPRCIVVYIFSFLDPRSLCRCSRVSWYFKFLSESDECWMPKCINLGWWPNFKVSPMGSGVWKRLFVETIVDLRNGRNAKFDSMEQEEMNSSCGNKEGKERTAKQSKKTEQINMKNFEAKKIGTKHHQQQRRPKIRQVFPLRPTSLSDQHKNRKDLSKMSQVDVKKDNADKDYIYNDDHDVGDTVNAQIEKDERLTDDCNDDPRWATTRELKFVNEGYGKDLSNLRKYGSFLKNIVHDDGPKEEEEKRSESCLFSARPWHVQTVIDDDYDDDDC